MLQHLCTIVASSKQVISEIVIRVIKTIVLLRIWCTAEYCCGGSMHFPQPAHYSTLSLICSCRIPRVSLHAKKTISYCRVHDLISCLLSSMIQNKSLPRGYPERIWYSKKSILVLLSFWSMMRHDIKSLTWYISQLDECIIRLLSVQGAREQTLWEEDGPFHSANWS